VATTEPTDTATAPKPAARKTTTSSGRSNPRPARPPATAETGQLRIVVKDGKRIEYAMSTVAKVTIENGEVVIVSNDGFVQRVPLSSILRMSIGP
jgi:hypothetical protein